VGGVFAVVKWCKTHVRLLLDKAAICDDIVKILGDVENDMLRKKTEELKEINDDIAVRFSKYWLTVRGREVKYTKISDRSLIDLHNRIWDIYKDTVHPAFKAVVEELKCRELSVYQEELLVRSG